MPCQAVSRGCDGMSSGGPGRIPLRVILYPPILFPVHQDMGHITRERTKLLNRVRRIRGQVEAIERALEGENDCVQVLQLIASTRGAINGLMAEVLEDHVREHVAAPIGLSDGDRAKGADELVDVIRTYFK